MTRVTYALTVSANSDSVHLGVINLNLTNREYMMSNHFSPFEIPPPAITETNTQTNKVKTCHALYHIKLLSSQFNNKISITMCLRLWLFFLHISHFSVHSCGLFNCLIKLLLLLLLLLLFKMHKWMYLSTHQLTLNTIVGILFVQRVGHSWKSS